MFPRIQVTISTVAQKTPSSLKVGSVLYVAKAYLDDDSLQARVQISEWHVRIIKRQRAGDAIETVYLTNKAEAVTWGKLSRRSGDYGWLPKIPASFRDSFKLSEYMGQGYGTTKSKAIALAIGQEKHRIRRYEAWGKEPNNPGYQEHIDDCMRCISALERRLKSLATKRKTGTSSGNAGQANHDGAAAKLTSANAS